jgi:hypothetical protein
MDNLLKLKESLAEWTDLDWAAFQLAACLGLMPPDSDLFRTKAKHIFWTNNPVGNALYRMLRELAGVGILEHDQEEMRYRWSQAFRGSWETAALAEVGQKTEK